MSADVGIVCGNCDWFNAREETNCVHCGNDLSLLVAEDLPPDVQRASLTPAPAAPDEASLRETAATVPDLEELFTPPPELDDKTVPAAEAQGVVLVRPIVIEDTQGQEPRSGSEDLHMEQARHYICKSCYSPIPGGHKFCGKCGAPTSFGEDYGTTQFYGAMQVPNKAKLILIKGEGLDGISYHLNATEHVAGRGHEDPSIAILFPEDPWLSLRHANFFYRDNKLFARDEDSANGIYLRIKEPTQLAYGQMFLCGEQVFRVEQAEALSEGPESDGTYVYASPTKSWSFKIVQVLVGGLEGTVVHDEAGKVTIGREDCHMNFLHDRFMSPKHAEVTRQGGAVTLTDLGSQNGTFLRIDQEVQLVHGDYVVLGKELLRVEVTP